MVRVVDQQHDACHGRGSGPCSPELAVREPIALCDWHVAQLAQTDAFLADSTLAAQRRAYARELDDQLAVRKQTEVEGREAREARREARRRELLKQQSLVYYVTRGKLIKIGYTTNMTARMIALMPDSILATEPGGVELERQRHKQFAHLRAPELGREYFTNGPDLLIHVADVIAEHGPPKMTTYPKVDEQCH